MSRRATLLVHCSLVLVALIWGGTFVALKVLIEQIGPLATTALRFMLVLALLLLLLPLLRNRPAIAPGDRWRLLAIGLLGVPAYHLALNSGEQHIPAGIASLVIATNPIFTALLAAPLLGERPGALKLLGILLAFAGLSIVVLLGTRGQQSQEPNYLLGIGLTLLAPLCWALATILSKPMLVRYPPLALTAYTTLIGSLFVLPLAPAQLSQIGRLSLGGWLLALYLAALATVLSYVLWFNGLRWLSTAGVTVYINLIPFFGLLIAWLVIDEPITPFLLLGGMVTVAGVALANLGDSRRSTND